MTKKGVSSEEQVRRDILKLLLKGSLTTSQITKALERGHSRATILKYKADLIKDGLIEPKLSSVEEHFRPKFFLTEKGRKDLSKQLDAVVIDGIKTISQYNVDSDAVETVVNTLWARFLKLRHMDESEPVIVYIGKNGKVSIQQLKEGKEKRKET